MTEVTIMTDTVVFVYGMSLYCICIHSRKPTTFATLDFAEKKKLLFALPGKVFFIVQL